MVVVANGVTRADLSRFLTDRWNPETQLTLTLKRFGFTVETTHARHVAVEL